MFINETPTITFSNKEDNVSHLPQQDTIESPRMGRTRAHVAKSEWRMNFSQQRNK